MKEILNKTYKELCEYFKTNKSLKPWENYFSQPKMVEWEIHHILEDKYERLANFKEKNNIIHDKDNLVFVNPLEHLILHIKIMEENKESRKRWNYRWEIIENDKFGVFDYCLPWLNDYYSGFRDFHGKYNYRLNRINLFEGIKNKKYEYFEIINYLISLTNDEDCWKLSNLWYEYVWNKENNIKLYNEFKIWKELNYGK